MSFPREVIPGRFYLITRRCTRREYLLRPDVNVNAAYEYCLAVAALKFEIDVVTTCAMSNHHHTVIFDGHGRYPAFLEHFHKLLARCLNVYWKHKENFWSSAQTSVVVLHGSTTIINKLVYVAMNPVAAHLVDRVHEWPGVNSYKALLAQRPVTVKRPAFFFRKDGSMPEIVTIKYVIPPELGDRDTVLGELQQQVEQAEIEVRRKRVRNGGTIVGRRGVERQKHFQSPSTPEPRRDLNPTLAASNKETRIEAILRRRAFLDAYRKARLDWSAGKRTVKFPPGTYWLKHFAGVAVSST